MQGPQAFARTTPPIFLKVLRKRKLAYVTLSSPNNIPKKIGVILTSKKDGQYLKSQNIIIVDEYDSIDHAIDTAMQKLTGKDIYSKIFIGIDPGERPGIAIVGDDILLQGSEGPIYGSRG